MFEIFDWIEIKSKHKPKSSVFGDEWWERSINVIFIIQMWRQLILFGHGHVFHYQLRLSKCITCGHLMIQYLSVFIMKIRRRSDKPCSNLNLFIIGHWPCMAMSNGRRWKKKKKKMLTNEWWARVQAANTSICLSRSACLWLLNELRNEKKVTHTIFLELEWSINKSNITRLKPVFINVNKNNNISPFDFFPPPSYSSNLTFNA